MEPRMVSLEGTVFNYHDIRRRMSASLSEPLRNITGNTVGRWTGQYDAYIQALRFLEEEQRQQLLYTPFAVKLPEEIKNMLSNTKLEDDECDNATLDNFLNEFSIQQQ